MLALAQLFHGGREGIFFDVGENDLHPFLREAFGEGAAHATGGAGDDGDFVFEGVHASPLSVGGTRLELVLISRRLHETPAPSRGGHPRGAWTA